MLGTAALQSLEVIHITVYRICISNCCFPNFSGFFAVLLFSVLCVLLLFNALSTSQAVIHRVGEVENILVCILNGTLHYSPLNEQVQGGLRDRDVSTLRWIQRFFRFDLFLNLCASLFGSFRGVDLVSRCQIWCVLPMPPAYCWKCPVSSTTPFVLPRVQILPTFCLPVRCIVATQPCGCTSWAGTTHRCKREDVQRKSLTQTDDWSAAKQIKNGLKLPESKGTSCWKSFLALDVVLLEYPIEWIVHQHIACLNFFNFGEDIPILSGFPSGDPFEMNECNRV